MKIQFFFKNVPEVLQKEIQDYFNKKRRSIEKLLQGYDQDTVLLRVNVEQFTKKSACSVEFVMTGPFHVVVGKTSHLYTKAIDESKDQLVRQIIELKEKKVS